MTPPDGHRFEPINWLLVFSPKAVWWVERFLPGRFKHVMAMAFSTETATWLVYEVTTARTVIMAMPEKEGDAYLGGRIHQEGAAVLRIERRGRTFPLALGFWCVPAIKHLIGLRSGALRPDGLWRDCLASGAEIVHAIAPVVPAVAAGTRGAESR